MRERCKPFDIHSLMNAVSIRSLHARLFVFALYRPGEACRVELHAILDYMTLKPLYQAILFDLDGTLTDPAEGITRCLLHALDCLEAPAPPLHVLQSWIGPPLRETLATYLQDEQQGTRALTLFRERFSTIGLFENQVYAGVPSLLADLHHSGCRLFLATGKPQPYAQRILQHFDLLPYFSAVGGSGLDGSLNTKEQVIRSLLPLLSPDERATVIMVGDREHDVLGARACQSPCIAVGYGYGSYAELQNCVPAQIVDSVAKLRAALYGTQHTYEGADVIV